MRKLNRTLAAISLAAALVPGTVRAQHEQQEQVPKELALALIPFGATEGGEIVVGKMPPDLAASITMPAGGRVLGSFLSLGYGQAVITLPFTADSARSFVRRSLAEHGWVPRDPRSPRGGGLQFSARGAEPTFFCKTGSPSGVSLTTQFYGRETLVRLTLNGACEEPGVPVRITTASAGARGPSSPPFSEIPPLWSPGDPMTSMRACRQGGTGFTSSSTQQQELKTDLTAQQILAYYGKQLDSAGWKTASPPYESASAMWMNPQGRDTSTEITLTVTRMPVANCFEIQLRTSLQGTAR